MYAAGKIPGSFFKREGRAGEKGTLDRPHDRPPAAPAVPQGLALRDAARRHPALGRPRSPVRHPRDERRLRRADGLEHPVPDAGRRRAHRQGRRQLRRQPVRGGPARGADLDLVVVRHRGGHPDGRGRRQRDPRGRDPRRAGHRARRDPQARAPPSASWPRRPASRSSRSSPRRSTRTSTPRSGVPRRRARRGHLASQDKLERQDATKAVEERGARRSYAGDPDAADLRRVPQQGAAGLRQAREAIDPRAHRRPARSGPTAATRRRSARSRSRPACCRARTAPRCSRAARRRPSRVAALGTTREEMRLDTLGLETSKRYFHHYNFPPFSVGRGRLHARPEAP